MNRVDQGYKLIDVRDEERLRYDHQGMAELVSSDEATVAYVRLRPGEESPTHSHADREDNALVLNGSVLYQTGRADVQLPQGAWVVARPTELHGFRNPGPLSAGILVFMPLMPPGGLEGTKQTDIRARIFRPDSSGKSGSVYETRLSIGRQFAVSPGKSKKIEYGRVHLAFCIQGRVMALVMGTKLSLEQGEGVFVHRAAVEVVGVAGHSIVAVFSTKK